MTACGFFGRPRPGRKTVSVIYKYVLVGFSLLFCVQYIHMLAHSVNKDMIRFRADIRSLDKIGQSPISRHAREDSGTSNSELGKVFNAWILSKGSTFFSKPFLTLSPSRGRLGNQMFQMASLVGIALKYNYTPVISSEGFDLSSVFDLTSLEQVSVDISNNKPFKEGNLSQYDRDITKYVDTSELIVPMNRTLDGYFQSYKHFNHSSRIIRHLLTFKKDILQETKAFLENHVASNTIKIGIHVRRGDFLSDYHRRLGRVTVDADYIHKAMEIFKQKFTDITFVVLSNDIVWCKKYITDERNKVVFSPFPSPGHDLAIMSQCDHVIISVGTFGWWGGWLAGGTVVYYSGYPLPGSDIDQYFVKSDYYPHEWIGIT